MVHIDQLPNYEEGDIAVSEKKLVIQAHKYMGESTVISLRLPKDMLSVIDQVANETGRTRNEILVLSLEFALDNMEINETKVRRKN